MVGEPSCLHTWLTFEGTFPQGFLVLLCLRLVPLITGHHLPTPHCLASHFLPGVSLFAQAFLPHLERSVNPRDGFCLGPEDGRGWGRVRNHSQELPQAGEGREWVDYRRGSPSCLGTGGGQPWASCWARH